VIGEARFHRRGNAERLSVSRDLQSALWAVIAVALKQNEVDDTGHDEKQREQASSGD